VPLTLRPPLRRLLTGLVATAYILSGGAVPPVTGPAARPAETPWAGSAARRAGPDVVVPPVDGPVTRFFLRPAERWSAGHRGVDLAAEPGTTVHSPVSGVVEFAGPVAGRTVLTVVRPDGLRTSLEPLADVAEAGTRVAAGDALGVLAAPAVPAGSAAAGATGHCGTVSCLHWGARRDGEYVDPLGLLEPDAVVLLPWP